jgi:hypothetical protein
LTRWNFKQVNGLATVIWPRRLVTRAVALVPLSILQPVLALVPRVDVPALSALHTVNALLIVLVAASVARESRPAD